MVIQVSLILLWELQLYYYCITIVLQRITTYYNLLLFLA